MHPPGRWIISIRELSATLTACTVWLLLGCFVVSPDASAGEQQRVITGPVALETAQYAIWAADGLPDSSVGWQTVQLPFFSAAAGLMEPGQFPSQSSVWFRFVVDRPQNTGALSLLFWRYNLSMTVFFNGEEIAANNTREGRNTFGWNRPLIANMSSSQWLPGDNEVLVRLNISPMGGNLAPVLFGPRDQLEDIYASRMFRQVDLNRILLAFALSIGFFTFALWLMRRQDDVYLWFSAMCVAWAIGSSHTVVYYNPLPFELWIPIVHIAIDACIFCMYGFIGRLAGARKPFRERLFLGWIVLTALINLNMPSKWFWQTAYLMHLVGVGVLGVIVIRVALIAVREKKTEATIITLAILGQIALFIFNAFQMFFSTGEAWDGTLVFAHFGLPVLLMIFAAVLLRRFTDALNTAETLNKDLEQKIDESRKIIERSFAERRVLEMNQAAEQERLKIYRDLHDDVGSRLLSIIHADAGNKLGDMARSALESLRQAVSKANTPDQPLSSLLADIREETELRLQGSGHEVEWRQQPLPEVTLPSEVAFNLNRIMKELVSNIIRHAMASIVRIDVSHSLHGMVLNIADNGRGFQTCNGDQSAGNGLGNIRSRAAEIDADIEFNSTGCGTNTRIVMPLPEPAAAPQPSRAKI
ncbi:MAG: 7TM diverse intracellular signaling domain-containing protein [Pseudohongiella sp.]|nr:7TM diverse intracellular signaling domain-containing protein [Pseudohongiella sp.]